MKHSQTNPADARGFLFSKSFFNLSDPSDKAALKRAFRRTLMLVLTAALLSALLISVANDMYAFVKPRRSVTLSLSCPTLFEFSALLEEHGIIGNPHIFALYVRQKEQVPAVENFSGELTLDASMSYREILQALRA